LPRTGGPGDEARIVAEIGGWIAAEVFGPVAEAMDGARPATVRVVVPAEPPEARMLLFRPLELARVGDKPLSLQDVTLVMQAGGDDGADVAPVRDRLRVLGLFSLPEGGRPLNLRRERYALVRLLEGIAAKSRAVDVRVLQYGVTRDRLREILEEDEALRELVARARELAEAPPVTSRGYLASWDPVIAAMLAADGGDAQAAAALDAELDKYEDSADWGGSRPRCGGCARARPARTCSPGWTISAPLADALRRILGGDRDPGLAERVDDPVQNAVVVSVLGHVGAG